jgi:hypothetical protein
MDHTQMKERKMKRIARLAVFGTCLSAGVLGGGAIGAAIQAPQQAPDGTPEAPDPSLPGGAAKASSAPGKDAAPARQTGRGFDSTVVTMRLAGEMRSFEVPLHRRTTTDANGATVEIVEVGTTPALDAAIAAAE